MPWFKLDDSTYDHPKIVQLSDGAFRLWVTAGLYCARHLTDGQVSEATLRVLRAKAKHCDELWVAGLWHRNPDGGYDFHDWSDYQPSRAEVQVRRKATRERVARYRDKRNGRFATDE